MLVTKRPVPAVGPRKYQAEIYNLLVLVKSVKRNARRRRGKLFDGWKGKILSVAYRKRKEPKSFQRKCEGPPDDEEKRRRRDGLTGNFVDTYSRHVVMDSIKETYLVPDPLLGMQREFVYLPFARRSRTA